MNFQNVTSILPFWYLSFVNQACHCPLLLSGSHQSLEVNFENLLNQHTYWTRVRSLALVTDSLTPSLLFSRVDLGDSGVLKMPTQYLSKLLLLVLRNVLVLVDILRLGLVKILKLKSCGDANVWLRLRRWILVNILRLGLVKILTLDLVEMLMFGWDFEANAWSRLQL